MPSRLIQANKERHPKQAISQRQRRDSSYYYRQNYWSCDHWRMSFPVWIFWLLLLGMWKRTIKGFPRAMLLVTCVFGGCIFFSSIRQNENRAICIYSGPIRSDIHGFNQSVWIKIRNSMYKFRYMKQLS